MDDVHPTGALEERYWSSKINPKICGDISVFVPYAPRPPQGAIDSGALAELEIALIRFNTNAQVAHIGHLLTAVEAVASSRFEGLECRIGEVLDSSLAAESNDTRIRQGLGNVESMRMSLRASEPTVSTDTLHAWHEAMIGPRQRDGDSAGSYRQVQNWIGYWGSTPLNATYVPPPQDLVPSLMADLVGFSNERTISPGIQAGIAHAHFETIHPYGDGNGRVGRVLIYRVLASRGGITTAPPPVSPILESNRAQYIEGLVAYRNGRPDIWIDAFVRLLTDAVAYGLALATAVARLEAGWHAEAQDIRGSAVDHEIVANMIEHPILDTQTVASTYGVSAVAARDALLRLADRGVVVERPRRRGQRGRPARVFEAAGLFGLLDEPVRQFAARRQHDS